MSKNTSEVTYVTEHILEIKHEPTGKFLDVRGSIADYITKNEMFSHWNINETSVSFFDTPAGIKDVGAVVSYDKIIFLSYNPSTQNYFEDKAVKFWKILERNEQYVIPEIGRFGARTKCFIPSKLSFNDINNRVYTTFFNEKSANIMGGRQTDQQIIFDLNENDFQVRIITGPVKINEAKRYFNFSVPEFEHAGLYIDVDYYQVGKIPSTEIRNLFNNAMVLFWQKIERIKNAIGI
jgi:hypothetical protein